jgi:hypothetical protein
MPAVAGHSRGRKRGVPIYFDPDQIEEINIHCAENEQTFSEAVRTLVEWGLEAAKNAR